MARYPSTIMAGCVVPWGERLEFLEDLFRDQVRKLLQETKHLYVFGTAGEGYAVTDRQYFEVARVFQDEMKRGGAEPMVGVIGLSLGTIVERLERLREMGIRRFQISLPGWGALAEKEVFDFFRETCGQFRDCEFLHYNLMRTKRLVTPAEYARLSDEHPNLVATKNSTDSMDRIQGLMTQAPEMRHFLTETGFLYGSLLGECGLLISLASTNWKSGHAYFDAGRRRDVPALISSQKELSGILQILIEGGGPGERIDGAYDKMLWRLHDRRFPLRLLPPYHGATEEGFERFAARLSDKYPHWAP